MDTNELNKAVARKETFDIVTGPELDKAWANANFGAIPRRDVLARACLMAAAGKRDGHTITAIMGELGLLLGDGRLSKKGRDYLWASNRYKK